MDGTQSASGMRSTDTGRPARSVRSASARPEIDPELKAGLAVVGGVFPPTITPDLIPFMRRSYASAPIEQTLAQHEIDLHDEVIAGHRGDAVAVSLLRPRNASGLRPGVVFAHSGGLMFGDRFSGLDLALDWVERLGAVLVTVEYRLAPEFPDPFPREDMYAALEWTVANARALGIRRDRELRAIDDVLGHLGLFGVAPTYLPQIDRHLTELLAIEV